MCGSCVTNVEALVVGAAASTGMVVSLAQRATDLFCGRSSADRRAASYAANAGFLSSLGHDPALLLGPPPEARPVGSSRALPLSVGVLIAT